MMRILYVHGYNGSPTGSSYTLFDKQLDKSIYKLHTIDYDAADPRAAIQSIRDYVRKHKDRYYRRLVTWRLPHSVSLWRDAYCC